MKITIRRLNTLRLALIPHCLLTIVIALSLFACDTNKEQVVTAPDPGKLVKVIQVERSDFIRQRSFPGSVVASRKVNLAFQVSGQLLKLPVKDGQLVKKDELLAELDLRDFQHDFDARKAELLKASQDVSRAKELLGSGTIPKATYDKAKSDYDVAVSNQRTSKKALDDASLRAPFSGIIAKTFVENFQNVRAKERILSLQDISHIDIEINLPEQDIAAAQSVKKINAQAFRNREVKGDVSFEALPGKKFKVKVKEYATQADPITQTYKITLTMPAPEEINILPGMTATLVLNKEEKSEKAQYKLPVSAVATDPEGKHFVWIVNKELMVVNKRLVTVSNMLNEIIIVTDGLKQGETIVAAGVSYLQEGMKIRILTSDQ